MDTSTPVVKNCLQTVISVEQCDDSDDNLNCQCRKLFLYIVSAA